MASPARFASRTAPLALSIALLAPAVLAGCGRGAAPTTADRLTVVAAFYPLEYAAAQVGGDNVEVVNLTPPGAEPHDLELSPQQVALLGEADLVVYAAGFQPALDEAIAQQAPDRALDVLTGIPDLLEGHSDEHGDEHGDEGAAQPGEAPPIDPHVWLNPLNMSVIGDEIASRLSALAPERSGDFASGAQSLTSSMDDLNAEWAAGTAECANRLLVVSHEAFGYLAQAYDFTQVGIAGLSPEAEPSPARLAEVVGLVEDQGVTTVYYETLVDPRVAETVAAETGARTAVLDPLEGLPEGSDGNYVTVMQGNLAQVREGQECA